MSYSSATAVVEKQKILQKSIQEENNPDRKKYKFLAWEFETRLIWTNIFGISLFHVLTIYILLNDVSPIQKPGIIIYGVITGIISGFGVTGGAHRYWSHRSYKAKLPLRIILLFCFSAAVHNSLLDWVRIHRLHHKFSETDADPHNSHRGFFFAHVGWLMMKKHPEVIRKSRQIDCSDLLEDPLVVFHQRYFTWIKLFCCFVLPAFIPPLLWGESFIMSIKAVIVRYVICLNYVWLVNSAAHMWGNRPYNKNIRSVENLVVSFVALGEGYHNYHHTFPWDYRTAEIGRWFNTTTHFLDFFQKLGWAYDMKSPSAKLVMEVIEKKGDGSHCTWGQEVPDPYEKTMTKAS